MEHSVEARNIFKLIEPGYYYIYLGGRKVGGHWTWNDGTTVKDDLFKLGQKDNAGQSCVWMQSDDNSNIIDVACDKLSDAILCQRKN